MAGRTLEWGPRDLIEEDITDRNRSDEEVKVIQAEEERIARCLFKYFLDLARPSLPQVPEAEAATPTDLPEDHFLDAEVFENGRIITVQVQLQPLHGNSLEAVSRFTISLPDSKTVKDKIVLREKAAKLEPAGRAIIEEDYSTVIRLLSYLQRPGTNINYRRQPKALPIS